jgi:hypothetical protein
MGGNAIPPRDPNDDDDEDDDDEEDEDRDEEPASSESPTNSCSARLEPPRCSNARTG